MVDMDRRALPVVIVGLGGAVSGIAAAHWMSTPLVLLAAMCSLAAGIGAIALGKTNASPQPLRPIRHTHNAPDAETGLPGFWSIEDALSSKLAVARRHLWPVTVIELALQPPPEPDDRLRHEALAALGSLLRITLRESDLAARVGHNRFLVVLDDTGEDGGVWTVERLIESIEEEFSHKTHLVAGLASYPTHGLTGAAVLRLAEAALHRAIVQFGDGHSAPVQIAPVEQA